MSRGHARRLARLGVLYLRTTQGMQVDLSAVSNADLEAAVGEAAAIPDLERRLQAVVDGDDSVGWTPDEVAAVERAVASALSAGAKFS